MAWPKSITHNLGWKTTSLVLATLVWLTLRSGIPSQLKPEDQRTFYRLPITVMTTATDDRVFRVEPATVDVTVAGETGLLAGLHPGDIQVFVNLTSVVDAKGQRRRIQVHTPVGASLIRSVPEEVFVESAPRPAPASMPER
jgi:hypothetical protein